MLNPCWGKLVQEGMFLSDEVVDMIFYCDNIPMSDKCKIYHSSYCLCVGMWRRDGEEDDGENRLCWTLALLCCIHEQYSKKKKVSILRG